MITALLVIAILVLLIVVHELGHFIAAKLSGVKVEEFGVGYPPRAVTFGTFGGTQYSLNWIPFGGFVRLFGDEGDTRHGRGSFLDAPRWKQAIILLAGIAMNAFAAWVLLALAFHIGIPQPVAQVLPGESARLIASDVVPASPAAAGGIKPGDEIVSIEAMGGAKVSNAAPEKVVTFVRNHAGDSLKVTFKSNGVEKHATMTPAQGVLTQHAGQPALGFALVLVVNRSLPWGAAMSRSFSYTLDSFKSVTLNLWGLLSSALSGGGVNLSDVVGPVGIVSYVGAASQNGIGSVLMLAALVSVNLAIFNLLPIPAFDGGRLAVLAIETVTRRNAPTLAMRFLNTLSIVLIGILMLVVTYHDIGRLLA